MRLLLQLKRRDRVDHLSYGAYGLPLATISTDSRQAIKAFGSDLARRLHNVEIIAKNRRTFLNILAYRTGETLSLSRVSQQLRPLVGEKWAARVAEFVLAIPKASMTPEPAVETSSNARVSAGAVRHISHVPMSMAEQAIDLRIVQPSHCILAPAAPAETSRSDQPQGSQMPFVDTWHARMASCPTKRQSKPPNIRALSEARLVPRRAWDKCLSKGAIYTPAHDHGFEVPLLQEDDCDKSEHEDIGVARFGM